MSCGEGGRRRTSRQMRGGSGGSSADEPRPSPRASRTAPWLENNPPAVSFPARQETGARDWERLSKQAADEQHWLRAKRCLGKSPRLGDWEQEERAKDAPADYGATPLEVNCSPDWDLGHIHQRAASCHQVSLDKQREPVELEESKASRAELCPDRVHRQQRALSKQSPLTALLPARNQTQPSRAELRGCQHMNYTGQSSLQARDLL